MASGYADSGATVEDIRLMRRTVSPAIQVKAAGGVRSLEDVPGMMAASTSRVGTSATESILGDLLTRSSR